jgi:hypothetical protein
MESIQPSLRDFGNPEFFPALKRRAIVKVPSGLNPLGKLILTE